MVCVATRASRLSYGTAWAIKNVETGEILAEAGRGWARTQGMEEDRRPLTTFGLRGGMALEIVKPVID